MAILFKSYLDDSADDTTKLFGVGGFVGPEAEWDKLEPKWVSAFPEGITYFHATDCLGGQNQFSPQKGFDIPKRLEILDTLTDLICQTDIKLICHAINVPVYVRIAPKRIENNFLGNKYAACFEAAVQSACRDYMQPPNKETGDVCAIFYEDSEYSDSVQRKLRNLRDDNNLWWRNRIGNATPGTKIGAAAIPLLQVADLGVFLGTKVVAEAPDGRIPWKPYYKKLTDAGKVFKRPGKLSRHGIRFLHALSYIQRDPAILDEVWDADKTKSK